MSREARLKNNQSPRKDIWHLMSPALAAFCLTRVYVRVERGSLLRVAAHLSRTAAYRLAMRELWRQ
eukprot:3531499-Amphidinium_carterae.1